MSARIFNSVIEPEDRPFVSRPATLLNPIRAVVVWRRIRGPSAYLVPSIEVGGPTPRPLVLELDMSIWELFTVIDAVGFQYAAVGKDQIVLHGAHSTSMPRTPVDSVADLPSPATLEVAALGVQEAFNYIAWKHCRDISRVKHRACCA